MKVLILGGGIGGQVASNLLSKRLGKKHDVVLVDRETQYEFPPSFPWVMMGWREPHQITRNLNQLEKRGVKYVNGEVSKIDPAERVVKTSAGDLTYDYLIVALGSELAPEAIPGFTEGAHHVYTMEAAMRLREELKRFSGGNVAMGVSSLPFKCPAAPYEAALLLDYYFRENGIRQKVNLQFFTPESRPMAVTPPEIGDMLKRMLEGRGISYHPDITLASVNPKKGEISFEGGRNMSYDLLVAVPPHRPTNAVRETGLTNGSAWIPVDSKTLRTSHDQVYAVGDITSIKLPNGKMLPKAGVFAHGQTEIVAHNIASEINGNGERKEWKGDGACFIETGFGKAAMAKGNFYTEPDPVVKVRRPMLSRIWHWYRILFEKYWLWRYF